MNLSKRAVEVSCCSGKKEEEKANCSRKATARGENAAVELREKKEAQPHKKKRNPLRNQRRKTWPEELTTGEESGPAAWRRRDAQERLREAAGTVEAVDAAWEVNEVGGRRRGGGARVPVGGSGWRRKGSTRGGAGEIRRKGRKEKKERMARAIRLIALRGKKSKKF